MLEEFKQPLVDDGVEESTDVRIEHPVYFPHREPDPQCIQRVVLTTPGPEAVAETHEVYFVDLFEHGLHGLLNDLVL